jgi:AcrR family transcriptional regulator
MAADIERCALELFAERGFDATTVQEIADASDISERTFFRYFPTKEAVLRSQLDLRVAQLEAALDARPPHEPVIDAARNALLELAEQYEADRESVVIWTAVVAAAPSLALRLGPYQHAFVETLAEFMRERLPVEEVDELELYVAVCAFLAATSAASSRWVESGAQGPLVPAVARALDLVEQGLATLADRRSTSPMKSGIQR